MSVTSPPSAGATALGGADAVQPASTAAGSAALSGNGIAPYRADIDGLRGIAILLVVVYHVWLGRVSGGVDVFLMISAFFLTASFVRRLESGAPLRLGTFWSMRFGRLLPAAVVTLLGVLVTAFLVYPPTMWPGLWRQTWASLFYVQNWQLAFSGVDYYAREEAIPSPLQHFWSLSVQGQVFVLWPLVFLLVALLARRTALRVRVLLAIAFGLIFAASFAFSITETAANQSFAYFDTRTRLWEFAAGSLLALALPFLRAPAAIRALLGWLGVAGIIACGIVIDVRGGFPGHLALWPVACTAAVIVGGAAPAPRGPTRMLASAPVTMLGRDAYALYLVHWPVLVTWMVIADDTDVGPWAGLLIIAISLALARLVTDAVDRPLRAARARQDRRAFGIGIIVGCIAAVAVAVTVWQVGERVRVELSAAQFAGDYPGAAALVPDAGVSVREGVPVVPDPTTIDDEWVTLESMCAGTYRPTSPLLAATCVQLPAIGERTGTVVVVGDSHAQQWMGAVLPIARAQGWDVVALLKGGCSFAVDEPPVPGSEKCTEWRASAQRYIARLQPAVVFGMATKSEVDGPGERVLGGLPATVDALSSTGADVVLFRDNPRFSVDIFECVVEFGADSSRCLRDRDDALAAVNPARSSDVGAAHVIDLSDYLCPSGICRPVIGNVAVYSDDNHLTRTYAATMAPMLEQELSLAGVIGQPE